LKKECIKKLEEILVIKKLKQNNGMAD